MEAPMSVVNSFVVVPAAVTLSKVNIWPKTTAYVLVAFKNLMCSSASP